jgi:hypothetical protein
MPASAPTGRRSTPSLSSFGAGCAKIYREKVTGAHNDRRELLKMLDHLAAGDVVTVTRIDRLARSTKRQGFGVCVRLGRPRRPPGRGLSWGAVGFRFQSADDSVNEPPGSCDCLLSLLNGNV